MSFHPLMAEHSSRFPLLMQSARSAQRLSSAIDVIFSGVERGEIRKVMLDGARHTIGSAVYDGWSKHIRTPHFSDLHNRGYSSDVVELFQSCRMSSLNDVLVTSKRLAKSKSTIPAVNAMREFINELMPLAEAAQSLKSKVVKGRIKNPPKPVNPDKIVRTCPCCFRQIAVRGGKMVHHGYERPGTGWQTNSCHGIRFPPLEVSNEGLVWMLGHVRELLLTNQNAYAHRENLTSLRVKVKTVKGMRFEEITKESPLWAKEFEYWVVEIKSHIRMLKHHVGELDTRLKNWKPMV
jgi:hypothetical protein